MLDKNKAVTEGKILHHSTYIETENRIVVARGCEEGNGYKISAMQGEF